MFSPTLFLPVLSLLALSALAMPAKDDGTPSFSLDKRVNEGDVLFEWPNAAWPNTEATVYYDTDWQKNDDVCAVSPAHPKAPFSPGWATVVNGGWTRCGGAILSGIDTDRIVAINQTLVWSDPKAFCGKEVKIFKADGEELLLDGKPFVLWDSCENCATKGVIIDVSARAMVELTPEKICSNNPKGVKYQILARNIWQPVENGIPGMNMSAGPLIWPPSKLPAPTPPFAQSDLGAVVTTTVVPMGPSPSAVLPGPSVAPGPSAAPGVLNLPAGSAGCSVYADLGKGKCEGRAYYVCNVLTNDIPPVMQWSVVSAHCPTYCDASLPAPCT